MFQVSVWRGLGRGANVIEASDYARNSASVGHHIKRLERASKDQGETMPATKVREQERPDDASQRESKSRNTSLDAHYGRIGISAVAAAVSQKGEPKPRATANSNHALRYERE